MSAEAVRKEFHPDAVEIIKFLRDVLRVNMADSDWKQAEQFIDAAVRASRSAAIQECAAIADDFANEEILYAIKALALKER